MSNAVTQALRRRGVDVLTTAQAGLVLIYEALEPREIAGRVELL